MNFESFLGLLYKKGKFAIKIYGEIEYFRCLCQEKSFILITGSKDNNGYLQYHLKNHRSGTSEVNAVSELETVIEECNQLPVILELQVVIKALNSKAFEPGSL